MKITHEQARKALLELVLLCGMSDKEVNQYEELNDYNVDLEKYEKGVKNYITQQEMVEELLKRYFELNRNPFILNEEETKEWCALESELKKVSEGK